MRLTGEKLSALESPLTAADVAALYRLILRREPENDAVIEAAAGTQAITLLKALLDSDEYRRMAVNLLTEQFLAELPDGRIETDASDEEMAALLEHARATWVKFGENDPYWSVLTNDAFRGSHLASAALEDAFFASGQVDMEAFRVACVRNDLTPGTLARSLISAAASGVSVSISRRCSGTISAWTSARRISGWRNSI
jgi:hypothetical protein